LGHGLIVHIYKINIGPWFNGTYI